MKVWYISYGSNINYERFSKYIIGGKTKLMNKSEIGCKNNTLPSKYGLFKLNHKLKFIESSKRWSDGGVAVLSQDIDLSQESYVVRYLIESEQFMDIIRQENNYDLDTYINLCDEEIKKGVSKSLFNNTRYSDLVFLGKIDGYNAYTFTCSKQRFNGLSNKPDNLYLKNIIVGLKSHCISDLKFDGILDTILTTDGIKGYFTKQELLDLVND